MKKDNINFANILGYKDWIYLMALIGVIVIAVIFEPKMILPGLIIWCILLIYSLHSNSKRRKEIEKQRAERQGTPRTQKNKDRGWER